MPSSNPKQSVYAATAKVAEELGLPEDWLNDAVKGSCQGQTRSLVPSLPSRVLR
jgi:hypothetical protein